MSKLRYDPGRTVEVILYLKGKPPKYGTGYRIGGRLILTVAHVFPNGAGETCNIRSRMKHSPEGVDWEEENAEVIWVDADLDAALVLLPENEAYKQPDPVKFAWFPPELSGERLAFEMFGFPSWAFTYDVSGSAKAEGRQINGEIAVSDYSSRGLIVLEANRSGEDWRGMSGAAVFCQGYLIGIQIEHQRPDRAESLSAQPIQKILENAEFTALLKAYQLSPELHEIKTKESLEADSPQKASLPPSSVELIGRDDLIQSIKQELAHFDANKPIVLMQTPGIGKSELSYYLLHDAEIGKRFPDGVLWAALGKKPNPTQELIDWAKQLNISAVTSSKEQTDKARSTLIRNWIGEKQMLIFLDDVWDPKDMTHFLIGGPNCATILTTRRAKVVDAFTGMNRQTSTHELTPLDDDDGLKLLERLAPDAVTREPEAAKELVRAVGGLPFALVLIGKHLASEGQGQRRGLRSALKQLKAAENRLKEEGQREWYQPEDAPLSLQASIAMSEENLKEQTRRVFHLVAIFRAKPKPFSLRALAQVGQIVDEYADYDDIQDLEEELYPCLKDLAKEGLLEEVPDDETESDEEVKIDDLWAYEQASEKFMMSQVIADYAYLQLDPDEAQELHITAAEYYQSCLFNYEENRTGEASPYERMYAYEDARWQQVKASWLYHLSFTDDFHVNMAFTQLYFDAFYWWGEYLEDRPFCDEILEEWQARYPLAVDRKWLNIVQQFHDSYPFGYQNKNSRGNWQAVEEALLALRKSGEFDGDLNDLAEDAGLRHLRVLTGIYLSEARYYQDMQDPQALVYLDEVLGILEEDAAAAEAEGEESDDSWIIPWAYWQKADMFLGRGELDQALVFVKESRDLSLDAEGNVLKLDLEIIGNSYRVEADVYWEQGQYAKAFQQYTKAMFCAWGFHCAGGAALDFYTVAYHHEMMDRIQVRLKELLWMGGHETFINAAAVQMQNFWNPYLEMKPIEDILALLQVQDWDGLAGYIFPPAPTGDEVEAGDGSEYYEQVLGIFPEMAKAVFLPRPFLAPLPPGNFVGRTALVDEIKQRIQDGDQLIVLGQSPGIGKTALAAVLVHDAAMRTYFQGGVLWAGLGHAPNIAALLGEWLLALNIPFERVAGMDRDDIRKQALQEAIGRRRMLLVLDDVWDEADLEYFKLDRQMAPNCVYLITTRRKTLLESLSEAVSYILPVLSKEKSVQLLERLAPQAISDNVEEAEQLAISAGGMPLALVLMGKYLNSQSRGGQRRRVRQAIERLQDEEQRLKLETVQSPLYQPEGPLNDVPLSLLAMLSVSYSELENSAQHAFLTLSIHKPKPSVFTDDFRKAMGVNDADFQQLLENGFVDEARQTAEDISFYEGYQTGYSSKPVQEMSAYEAGNTFYEIANIVKDFSKTPVSHTFDTDTIRELHKKAAEYYSDWLTNFENINSDATPYERMYRYVWPRWQFVMGQLIDHLGEVDSHNAQIQFANLYFDAFWWWGNYREFPFCEQLLQWGERYHYKAEWVWMDYVIRFHKAYPVGYYIDYAYEDKERWHEVQQMLEALSTYAEAHRPSQTSDRLRAQYRHLRMVTNIFMAESFQYQDVHDPRAEQYYQEALALIDQDDKNDDDFWNIPWLLWHLSNLYLQQDHDDQARNFAEKALNWAMKEVEAPCQRDNEIIANAYRVLADVLFNAGDYESAFIHYANAVLYAWGFHACPNTPNFYSVRFHEEMLERIQRRLRALHQAMGLVAAEKAYAVLLDFWQGIYDIIAGEEGSEAIFQWTTAGDLSTFLQANTDTEDGPTLHLLPVPPSVEAINQGLDSSYYQLTRKGFLSKL